MKIFAIIYLLLLCIIYIVASFSSFLSFYILSAVCRYRYRNDSYSMSWRWVLFLKFLLHFIKNSHFMLAGVQENEYKL